MTSARYRSDALAKWAGKIGRFLDDSLEVFGYFSKYSGHPPADIEQLKSLLKGE